MRCFLFFLLLALATGGARRASAQKVIEKTVTVAPGQRVFLNLRQASSIRIRAGAAAQVGLKATVSINQNRLNDALLLTFEPVGDELRVASDFDKELLRNAAPGDCPGNSGTYYGDTYFYGSSSKDKNRSDGKSGDRVCADIAYDITVPAGVTLRVSTYSGNIDIAGLTGPIEAKSLSGFVDVTWAPKSAELSLKTITGEVYTDQDVVFSNRKENPIVGYQLRGMLGTNGPLVKLESISNDVYFRKRK